MGKRLGQTDTSRGQKGRHLNCDQCATQPLQQDLGERGSASSVERRDHDQAAQKRNPQRLQQLPRDHAPISARQSAQQNHVGEGKVGSRPQALRPAGRLPQKQIMRRPYCQPTHHSGAVDSVELHPLHQFHCLREGL